MPSTRSSSRLAALKSIPDPGSSPKPETGVKRKAKSPSETPALDRGGKAIKPASKKAKTNDSKPLPVKKKAKKNKVEITESNVVYLGHIPQGFADREMKSFFAQFGGVRRTKLFKSEKTNRSKGYAFIQFDEAQVAATAAEAMDGYFLGDRKLVCHVVPPEKLHSGMFLPPKQVTPKPALAPAMPNIPNIHHIGSRDQRDMVPEAPRSKNAAKRAIKSSVKRQAAWEAAGIDF